MYFIFWLLISVSQSGNLLMVTKSAQWFGMSILNNAAEEYPCKARLRNSEEDTHGVSLLELEFMYLGLSESLFLTLLYETSYRLVVMDVDSGVWIQILALLLRGCMM